jgi:hypothetical protein
MPERPAAASGQPEFLLYKQILIVDQWQNRSDKNKEAPLVAPSAGKRT